MGYQTDSRNSSPGSMPPGPARRTIGARYHNNMEPAQPLREDPDWVKAAAQAHVHYPVPGMEHVPIRSNLTFSSSDGHSLEFDFYGPISETTAIPTPCVILIHGGPVPPNLLTTPKDWGWFQSIGRLLGTSGFAAVMFNHRFFGLDTAQKAMTDVQQRPQICSRTRCNT